MSQWLYSQRWRSERPMLGALGQVVGVNLGDGFALGFNGSSGFFGPDAEDIAPWLERMNLATNVVSEQIAGIINPYLSVIGLANGTWTPPSSFRDAILAAIGELGFEIDYSSPINYRITPRVGGVPVQAQAPAPRPRRPRPAPESEASEESLYFDIVGDLPQELREPYTPPSSTTTTTRPPSPPPKPDGISTTWLLLGFGLLAVVLATGDRK